jgi:hypothetical protein
MRFWALPVAASSIFSALERAFKMGCGGHTRKNILVIMPLTEQPISAISPLWRIGKNEPLVIHRLVAVSPEGLRIRNSRNGSDYHYFADAIQLLIFVVKYKIAGFGQVFC